MKNRARAQWVSGRFRDCRVVPWRVSTGLRTHLPMFEVWMYGVVLCFAQSICLVRLAVVLWRDKMLL